MVKKIGENSVSYDFSGLVGVPAAHNPQHRFGGDASHTSATAGFINAAELYESMKALREMQTATALTNVNAPDARAPQTKTLSV